MWHSRLNTVLAAAIALCLCAQAWAQDKPADGADQLASALINATSPQERARLLAENEKLMTAELRDALIRRIAPIEFRGDYKQSGSLLQIVLAISERINDKQGIATTHRRIGNAYRVAGKYEAAIEQYQDALAGFVLTGARVEHAATVADIGIVHFAAGRHALALESFQKALREYEALNNRAGIADTVEQIASVHYDQENYDAALEFFLRCLKLRQAAGRKAEIAATFNSIANVYFQQDNYSAAIENYQKAITGFTESDQKEAIAATTANIASAYFRGGNYDAAIEQYGRAYKLEDQLRNRPGMADALIKLATVYSAVGNYSLAIESLNNGMAQYVFLRDKSKTANAQAALGEAYQQVRNYDAALENYQKSLAAFLEMNDDADAGTTIAAIGNVQYLKGSYARAIDSYQEAIKHFEKLKHAPGIASLHSSIASAYHSDGKSDLALEFYQKSMSEYEALKDAPKVAAALEDIAGVHYMRADYAKSLEFAGRAGAIAQQTSSLDTLWRVRLTEGLNYRTLGQVDKASASFEQSVKIVEAMRGQIVRGEQRRFFQGKQAAFVATFESLVAEERVDEAFDYAERMKINTVWDGLQSGGARITKQILAREAEQERNLENDITSLKARINNEKERKRPDQQKIAAYGARLEKAIADYRAFETRLYAANPQLKILRAESLPLKVEETTGLMPDPSTALVEFVVTDSALYLLAITRGESKSPGPRPRASTERPAIQFKIYVIGANRSQLAERVAGLRSAIAARDRSSEELARELYDLILKPADEQLKSKATWVIVPDAVLWQLPFQALQPADGRFLIEDHTISYAPSLTALGEMMKRPAPTRIAPATEPTLIAMGNPLIGKQTIERIKRMSDEKLDPMPEAESEVKALEQVYGAARSKIFTGAQASEETAKEQAGKSTVAHFAAPATFNDASPMYSHVALARAEESGTNDGLVEVWEMMKQAPASRLVVLSASESARASTTGDGMTALSWSLFVAGCPASVVGQWKADAAGTIEFMTEFHRNLNLNPLSRTASRAAQNSSAYLATAQALRQAAQKLIRSNQYQHPFFWASFRVLGNWR